MSTFSNITFYFRDGRKTRDISISQVIEFFFKQEWTIVHENKIFFTPLGDNNDFDWQYTDASNYNVIVNMFNTKQASDELVCVGMYKKSTNVGMEMFLYPELDKISCNLSTNRVCLQMTDITDFSWYIDQIAFAFYELGLVLENIDCSDIF